MKAKICLILLLLLAITMGGCLDDNKIKEGQVQYKDLIWRGPNAFNLIVNNEGEPIVVNIAIVGEYSGSYGNLKISKNSDLDWIFELKKGENILSVNYFEYNTWLGFKKQGTLSLRTISQNGKTASVEVLRKVIDMPYLNVEIKQSNSPIHNGDYVTITNRGNLAGRFSIKDGNSIDLCNEITLKSSPQENELEPGSSGNFNIILSRIKPCDIPYDSTGQISSKILYRHFGEPQTDYITVTDINLNYVYE